jgi:hypothetical protein
MFGECSGCLLTVRVYEKNGEWLAGQHQPDAATFELQRLKSKKRRK